MFSNYLLLQATAADTLIRKRKSNEMDDDQSPLRDIHIKEKQK